MFIDHTPSLLSAETPVAVSTPPPKKSKKLLYVVIGAGLVLILGGSAWWYFGQKSNNKKPSEVANQNPPEVANQNPKTPLPENPLLPSNDSTNESGSSNFRAETLAFGSFYKSLFEPLTQKIKNVDLPINVKSQVANYYVVARKINIDSAIPSLNKNGFAIIDSPFPKTSDNFFALYSELNQRGLPILMTSDFLLYYYQNSLKQLYKEIESSYFYDNLWKVNKQLFEAANSRYQERQRTLSGATDSLLEAERLEAGYFATSLLLLSPKPEQISDTEDLVNTTLFKPSEAERYEFTVPGYLSDDVSKEIALIKEAKKTEKSPLMLYSRNYSDFKIPAEYNGSAKLKNFYIASRWQATLFPLNFRDEDCPNCSLDRDDWTINQIGAYLMSEDMSANQSLKNEWAKVYKVMSFFSGLRSGLTYLHYQAVRQETFPEKSATDIFATDALKNLQTMQEKLKKITFKLSEGGLSDNNPSERPVIGMRLLQTSYWPDRYIYDRLTYEPVGPHNNSRSNQGKLNSFFTSCFDSKEQELYRCRGIGFDILGTVDQEKPSTKLMSDNINYKNYQTQRSDLIKEFSSFNQGEWYVNNFWTTLSIVKAFINEKLTGLPYSKTAVWKERQTNAALVGLTTLALSGDDWQPNLSAPNKNLQTTTDASKFHYIEVQSALNDELVANATMLFKSLVSLDVIKDNDAGFKELIDKLKTIRQITRQELEGETLSSTSYQFIVDFVSQYSVSKVGSRTTTVSFYNPLTKREESIKQTIGPLKLLLIVYEENGQKVLVVGPVVSYKEQ